MNMKNVTVAVIYHSGYGHTERIALAIKAGIKNTHGAKALLFNVEEAQSAWEELEKVDAIIFGSPTYMGNVSAEFKAFADATSSNVLNKNNGWANKLAAGFTNSASRSGDKLATLQYLSLFAAQHSMHWINLGLPSGHNGTLTSEDSLNRHGFFIGLGAQSDFDSSPDIAPPSADLRTGLFLGERVAEVALQFKYGKNQYEI